MVLVPVLVTDGLGNDGDCVDGLHQSPLCQGFCHHLTAKVRQDVPEGYERKNLKVVWEKKKAMKLKLFCLERIRNPLNPGKYL